MDQEYTQGRERENLLCRESKLSDRNQTVKDLHTSTSHSYGDFKGHNGHSCDTKDTFSTTALNSHTSGLVSKGITRTERDYCNNVYNKEHIRDSNSNNLKYLTSGQLSSPPSGERNGAQSLERRMNTNGRGAMTRSSTPTTTSSESLPWMPPPHPPPPHPPPTNRPHHHSLDRAPIERHNLFVNPVLLPPSEPPSRVYQPDPYQPVYTSSTTPAGVYSPMPVYPPTTYPQYPHVSSSLPHPSGQLLQSAMLPPDATYSLLLSQMRHQHQTQQLGIHHHPSRTVESPSPYYGGGGPMRNRAGYLTHDRGSPPSREDQDRRVSPHHLPHQPYHPSHPHSHPRFSHPHPIVPGHSSVKTEPSGIIPQQGHQLYNIDATRPHKYGPLYKPGGLHSSTAAAPITGGSSGEKYLSKPSVKNDEPSPKIRKERGRFSTTPPLHPVPQCVTSTSSTSSSVTSAQTLPHPPSQPHYPPHFMKGSIIQLASGQLKRVEDLRTEDFTNSADISADLKIDSSQVVHIEEMPERGTCILGFSVGEQKIRVTVEATVEHPFFVFGQGWSSCNPEKTLQRYGLQCFKLVVGDICISLTQKQTVSSAAAGSSGSAATITAASTAIGGNAQYLHTSSSSQSRPSDSFALGSGGGMRHTPHQQQHSPGQSEKQGSLLGSAKSGHISGDLSGHLHGSPPPSSVREGGGEDSAMDDDGGGSPITVGDAEDESFVLTEQSRKRRWSAPDQVSGTEEGPIDVTDSSSSGTNRTPDNTTRSDQYGTT